MTLESFHDSGQLQPRHQNFAQPNAESFRVFDVFGSNPEQTSPWDKQPAQVQKKKQFKEQKKV